MTLHSKYLWRTDSEHTEKAFVGFLAVTGRRSEFAYEIIYTGMGVCRGRHTACARGLTYGLKFN